MPREIIELMKEPEKRSEKVKELIKAMPSLGIEGVLSVEKAEKIARELGGFTLKKMFEVAAYVMRIRQN